MRKTCKTQSCKRRLTPTTHSGARSVYCKPCDRASARLRMRELRTTRTLKQATSSYYRRKHGDVYIVHNPSFPGWIKVGCALDANDRLNAFQTATPHRNFSLKWSRKARNKLDAELACHQELEKHCTRKGEWFKIQPAKAKRILERMQVWQN